MPTILVVYLLGVVAFIIWTAIKTQQDGWDPAWSIPVQLVIAVLWAMLWPVVVVWILFAVLAAGWERRY